MSVIEALAYGLPIAISRLPSVVEMLPEGYAGVADVENPALAGLADQRKTERIEIVGEDRDDVDPQLG